VAPADVATGQLAQQRAKGIRTAVIIALVVVILRYLPLTNDLFVFPVIENLAYDVAFDSRQPQPPADIVIVAIDDESIRPDRLGRFPWSRGIYAELLDRLAAARVVAFDILFTEPDRYDPEADARFARAIQRHGRVVLGAYKRVKSEAQQSDSDNMPAGPSLLT